MVIGSYKESLNFLRSDRSAGKDHMETEPALSCTRLDIGPRLFPPHYRSRPLSLSLSLPLPFC